MSSFVTNEERFGQKKPRAEARALKMSVMRELPIQWLWPGRVVMENLTLLVGDPEIGKSTVAFDLAARLSRGGTWPDGVPIGEPKSTLFVSAEDHACFTVRPALSAAGADMEHIATMWDVLDEKKGEAYRRPFELPRDMDELAKKIQELPNCKLVVIDPIMAIVKPSKLRGTLRELMLIANNLHFAVLGLAHLRPGGTRAVHRTEGGNTLTSAARGVWMVTPDPICEERRLLLPVKNNLVRERTGLAFSAVDAEGWEVPRLEWEGAKVEQRVDVVLAEQREFGKDADKIQEAITFLREALAGGPRLVNDVELEALADWEISHRTLVRARKVAGIKKHKNKQGWWMSLAPMEGENPIYKSVGTLGTLGTLAKKPEENEGFSRVPKNANGTLEANAEGRPS